MFLNKKEEEIDSDKFELNLQKKVEIALNIDESELIDY